jgi:hypothetical protein
VLQWHAPCSGLSRCVAAPPAGHPICRNDGCLVGGVISREIAQRPCGVRLALDWAATQHLHRIPPAVKMAALMVESLFARLLSASAAFFLPWSEPLRSSSTSMTAVLLAASLHVRLRSARAAFALVAPSAEASSSTRTIPQRSLFCSSWATSSTALLGA